MAMDYCLKTHDFSKQSFVFASNSHRKYLLFLFKTEISGISEQDVFSKITLDIHERSDRISKRESQ